jgi:hypothetical protein
MEVRRFSSKLLGLGCLDSGITSLTAALRVAPMATLHHKNINNKRFTVGVFPPYFRENPTKTRQRTPVSH